MPASKKPRKPKSARPAPRRSQVDLLIDDLTDAVASGDLDLYDHTAAALRRHAGLDPTLDARFFESTLRMRDELAASIAITPDINAALWVGDMKRVQQLEEANLPLASRDTNFDDDPELDKYFAAADPFADLATGKAGALDALLATGTNLETFAGPDVRPALFAAVEAPGRSAADLQRLLDAGADATDVLDSGHGIVAWALMYDHYDSVTPDSDAALFDLLFAHGATARGETDDFGPDLIAAIILSGVPQVKALLHAGADLDVVAPDAFELADLIGANPLMLAAPKPDVVQVLLDHGADPAGRDANGRSVQEFISDAVVLALDNAKDDWGHAHAARLQQSLALIRAALNR